MAAPLGTLSAVVPTRDTREPTLRCLACLEAGGIPGLGRRRSAGVGDARLPAR